MDKTTKTILIVSSVIALGGIAFLMMKRKRKNSYTTDNTQGGEQAPTQQTTTPINQSLKGVDITRGGTYLPTSQELKEWRKANPLNLQLPSLSEMLKGTNWLKIGEQVPQKTTNTPLTKYTSNSNFGIDPNKLAEWNAKYGTK